jgi:hypothetical protein
MTGVRSWKEYLQIYYHHTQTNVSICSLPNNMGDVNCWRSVVKQYDMAFTVDYINVK